MMYFYILDYRYKYREIEYCLKETVLIRMEGRKNIKAFYT